MNFASINTARLNVYSLFMGNAHRLRSLALEDPSFESFTRSMESIPKLPLIIDDEYAPSNGLGLSPQLLLTQDTSSELMTFAIWKLARELYANPSCDRADLSAWLDNGLVIDVQEISKASLIRKQNSPTYYRLPGTVGLAGFHKLSCF